MQIRRSCDVKENADALSSVQCMSGLDDKTLLSRSWILVEDSLTSSSAPSASHFSNHIHGGLAQERELRFARYTFFFSNPSPASRVNSGSSQYQLHNSRVVHTVGVRGVMSIFEFGCCFEGRVRFERGLVTKYRLNATFSTI